LNKIAYIALKIYNNTKIGMPSDIFRPIRAATTNAAISKITNSYQPQYDNRDISRSAYIQLFIE